MRMYRLAAGIAAALGAVLVVSPSGIDAAVSRSSGLATRKSKTPILAEEPPPLLGTLVQTHTDERVPLDDRSPTAERFATLLSDRVTGERHEFDPRLLDLLRSLARRHPGARFQLVSGYRSPKRNEMMRKKGRHVASHSEHSLGHAVDFRLVGEEADKGIDPRVLEREIRQLGWEGGVGVYTLSTDWFVHAAGGKMRRWDG